MGRKYGRVLVVDLGERSSRTMEEEPEILKRYMGGRGWRPTFTANSPRKMPGHWMRGIRFFLMTGPLKGIM